MNVVLLRTFILALITLAPAVSRAWEKSYQVKCQDILSLLPVYSHSQYPPILALVGGVGAGKSRLLEQYRTRASFTQRNIIVVGEGGVHKNQVRFLRNLKPKRDTMLIVDLPNANLVRVNPQTGEYDFNSEFADLLLQKAYEIDEVGGHTYITLNTEAYNFLSAYPYAEKFLDRVLIVRMP